MNKSPRLIQSARLVVIGLITLLLASVTLAAGGGFAAALTGQSGSNIVLNPQHPERYVVKLGDTLWDISAMFLRDPWYWPEIWQINPQVANPHLIYPGDVLVLVYVDGKPQLQVEGGTRYGGPEKLSPQIRSEDLSAAITTIPLSTIGAFLSKGTVLQADEVQQLPYVAAIRDGHLIAGAGNDIYVRGETGEVNQGYSVIHVGDPLIDPDDNSIVGYQGIFVGEGTIRQVGDPSTLHLLKTRREALTGDRLLTQDFDIPLQFYPRSPDQNIEGRIIHVVDGLAMIGQYQIVVLNRGSTHGLDVGHVLTVWQTGETMQDRTGGGMFTTPDESAGTLMVFKTYDRISYALIMEATSEIHILDKVKTPG